MASMNLADITKAIDKEMPDVTLDFVVKEEDGTETPKTSTYAHLALVEKEKRELADEALKALSQGVGKRLKQASEGNQEAMEGSDEDSLSEEEATIQKGVVAIFEKLLEALALDDEAHAEFIEVIDPNSRKYDVILARVVTNYLEEVGVGEAKPSAAS